MDFLQVQRVKPLFSREGGDRGSERKAGERAPHPVLY